MQQFIHLQANIANRLIDAFNNVTKLIIKMDCCSSQAQAYPDAFNIPTMNALTSIYVPEEQTKIDKDVP